MCRENRMSKGDMKKFLGVTLFGASLLVAGCVPKVDVHGYVPVAAVVASVAVGDTQESVLARLGQPTTRGLEGTNAWYYISSKVRRVAFFAPKEIERQIVAITFSGSHVAQIERYGLEDGRLINLNNNTTVTDGRKLTFFEQFLGNIGNFSAENFIGG
ncbi:MAG: outer membrane protein assembly factor BamE [Rhodobacteraceae bacterium]|nr:outer membrane protein assembly factor BamE [Paracoccaceae bacterium]